MPLRIFNKISRGITLSGEALCRYFHLSNLGISTRLTMFYAAALILGFVFTSFITVAGIYFSLYHQAEIEVDSSVRGVLASIAQGTKIEGVDKSPLLLAIYREDLLTPGVVLRVTNENQAVCLETDAHYPSIHTIETHIDEDPPLWANPTMQVATLHDMQIYYKKVDIEQNGHAYTLHFFKTITAERHFIEVLVNFLAMTNLLCMALALVAGYFVSRRILKPMRSLTQAAREIEVRDLSRRLEVPPAHDEVRELALTINYMLDRIEHGFDLQRRFVSDASHELRTPVTVIRGYSDMLTRWGYEDPETLAEGIAAISSEAADMQELIERLLFLARADQKRQIPHKEEVELQVLVDDLTKKLTVVAGKHSLQLVQNEKGRTLGDPLMLRQMLRIIVENAIKYTPDGGHIEISSRREGKYMTIAVQDDGIGISKKDLPKIFDRFFRADAARVKAKGSSGGTGLGLSIARWIAEQHGVMIAVESELGEGTTFTLRIPLLA